ncbi:MAG: nucleotidyltransferase [Planctomycetota bacterium]
MATIRLPTEFKEFLKLLNSGGVDYLVVGGYAVAFHGHPRATGDLDLWIATSPDNVARVRRALGEFGFSKELVASAPLDVASKVIRMGNPPLRIELLTSVSGVDFDACHRRRETEIVDAVEVAFISLADLRANKRAAGRAQDVADLEELR